jgi:CheY-like chemotaxis protein
MKLTRSQAGAVLVVDDEPLVRMYAVDVLSDAGHVVFEAGDANEALALIDAHPEIKVLFTDINMPGPLDGLDLARMVHRRSPGVHLILTSGRPRPLEGAIPDDGRFLPKPYAGETVTRLVAQLLASPGASPSVP